MTRIPAPGNPRYLVDEAFYDAGNNIFWDGQQAWIYIEPIPKRAAESWSATTALEPAQLRPGTFCERRSTLHFLIFIIIRSKADKNLIFPI